MRIVEQEKEKEVKTEIERYYENEWLSKRE